MSPTVSTILAFGLFALVILASIWVLWRTHRSDAVGSSLKWSLAIVGPALGIGLSFISYQPNPDFRVEGLPVPIVVFERNGNAWTDFPSSLPMGLMIVLLNALFVSAVLHACALSWSRIGNRSARRSSSDTPHVGP